MMIYIDLERVIKDKNVSKNKVCEVCHLQRTQLNNYCKSKVSRMDLDILARLCAFSAVIIKETIGEFQWFFIFLIFRFS